MKEHGCGTKVRLNEEFDAYYCPSCLVWTESRCSSNGLCEFCGPRPQVPAVEPLEAD